MRTPRFRILALAAVAFSAYGALPAAADPGSTPPAQSIVATSDLGLVPLCDQFSTDYDATSPAWPLNCWSAVGSSPIESKQNSACSNENRPNGSTAAIAAVATSPSFTVGGVSYKCWDVAFSERALTSSDPADMAQTVFAEDLASYSYLPGGHIPSNLTPTDVEAIFSCDAGLIDSSYGDTPVTENEIGGTGTDQVMPVIPQSGSGTRQLWMSNDLDLSNSTIGSCVTNGTYTYDGTSYPIEENEGTNPVFVPADNPDADDVIFPYSGGDYVCYNDTKACQATQFDGEFDSGSLVLGDVNGLAPLSGTAPNQTINAAGFYTEYDHGLYAEFVSTGTPPYVPVYLQPLLGDGVKGSGWICTKTAPATGQADITKYGFADTANCATVSVTP